MTEAEIFDNIKNIIEDNIFGVDCSFGSDIAISEIKSLIEDNYEYKDIVFECPKCKKKYFYTNDVHGIRCYDHDVSIKCVLLGFRQ